VDISPSIVVSPAENVISLEVAHQTKRYALDLQDFVSRPVVTGRWLALNRDYAH
jgi:hypothetical protein